MFFCIFRATSKIFDDTARVISMKIIEGSWFEFQHANTLEGLLYNPTLAKFTADDWKLKVREAAGLGMDTLVLQQVASNGYAFYHTPLRKMFDLVCDDPIEAVLSAADECGINFFIANDWWDVESDWNRDIMAPDTVKARLQSMGELFEKYGHHKSFYGWYYSNELYLKNGIPEKFQKYLKQCVDRARELDPDKPSLIAPYGTGVVVPNDDYVRQMERTGVQYIAYQDEIGCLRHGVDDLERIWSGLRKAHDKLPQVKLWADVEIFEFHGEVGFSPLHPAPFERCKRQLELAGAYCDKILIYEFIGLMNPPDSKVFAGPRSSVTLYNDYVAWRDKVLEEQK